VAFTLALTKASYRPSETITGTATATAGELTRAFADLRTAGPAATPSGLRVATTPAVTVTDSRGKAYAVTGRTDTTVTIAGRAGTPAGAGTITVAAGAASASAAYTVTAVPAGGAVRQANGILPWGNPFKGGMLKAYGAKLLAEDWVGGLSAFCRWDDLTRDGRTFEWGGFDAVADLCAAADKPFLIMMIVGNDGHGLPAYVRDAIPATEFIDVRSEVFPVFWSATGTRLLDATLTRLIDRYKDHPTWAGLRYTDFWANHGEPWFAGGAYGKTAWPAAWDRSHGTSGATLATVQDAYQQREKDRFAWLAGRVPAHIAITQAGGDGLYDVAGAIDTGQPGRHPAKLATWTEIRATHGPQRAVYQYNGVNAGKGASGWGEWLKNAFGPLPGVDASRRGRIGSQPVAEVGTDRLSYDGAVDMIRALTDWGYSNCELYIQDAVKALQNDTPDKRKLRAVIDERRGSWHHV